MQIYGTSSLRSADMMYMYGSQAHVKGFANIPQNEMNSFIDC